MTREQNRWKVVANQSDDARGIIEKLLQELNEIDMQGYLPGYAGPASETFDRADQARTRLKNHLSQLSRELGTYNQVDPEKVVRISGELDEAIRTLKAHRNTLDTWIKWIEGEMGENEKQKTQVKELLTAVDAYNEWLKIKAVPKSKSRLGTHLQFQLIEVSQRNSSWLVYHTNTPQGKYRIIQQDNRTWRLDKQDVTWNAVNDKEYRKPDEAAKDLEALLR